MRATPLGWMLVLAVVLIFGWLLFFSGYFTVGSVVCKSDQGECAEDVLAELERLKGKPIFTLETSQLQARITSSNPLIKRVKISSRLPATLEVEIKTRKPAAALTVEDSTEVLISDSEGFIFASEKLTAAKSMKLPLIVVGRGKNLLLGETVSEPLTKDAIRLAITLQKNFIAFQEINLSRNRLRVEIESDLQALFSQESDFEAKVTTLQRILSEVTIDSQPLTVDLRFAKPALVFE